MKTSDKLYLVINLMKMEDSTICRTIIDVANIIGMHRNSIDPLNAQIYRHFFVKPIEVNRRVSNSKGNPDNFKKSLF